MPNPTFLTVTLDELTAERRALAQVIEKRKEALDEAINRQEQSTRYALWLRFMADNERDLLTHLQLERRINKLCQRKEE